MAVDFTILRPGTLIHGGGIGILIEPLSVDTARVMSLTPEDAGHVHVWGNACDVVSEPRCGDFEAIGPENVPQGGHIGEATYEVAQVTS